MSILTDCLDRILNWLEQNEPSFARALQPGLSESQIRERVENEFPLSLPTEFYELYQWRNGTSYGEEEFAMFLPGYSFNSLEYALDQYQEFVEEAEDFAESFVSESSDRWRRDLLPIFSLDSKDHMCILGSEELQDRASILWVYTGERLQYTSLTSMMQTIAECYDRGAYYISEDGDIEVDYDRAKSIRLQYNSISG